MTETLGIHTLHVEHAFLLALYSLLTVVNSRMHKGIRGIYWFSLYNLLAFLGALLVALRGHTPDLVSVVFANLFVAAGYVALFISLARFFGSQLTGLYYQLGLLAVAAVTMLQYGWLHPDTTKRLLAYSLVLGCLQAHTAWLTIRRSTMRGAAGTSMAVILGGLFLMNLARIATLHAHAAPQDYLKSGNQLAWFVLVNTALQCGAMVSYVWLTASFLREDLAIQASTDALTGVLNRRAMDTAAHRVLTLARTGDRTSAISIDLDHFKKINDSHGHGCGDAALIALARCLQQGLRDGDFLGRMGGDEFVVLLPRTSLTTARIITDRLQHLVSSLEFLHEQTQVRISASFGVAEIPSTDHSWDHLLRQCDKLLYAAKRTRRNPDPSFFPALDSPAATTHAFAGGTLPHLG